MDRCTHSKRMLLVRCVCVLVLVLVLVLVMHLPSDLPQFHGAPALFIVCGGQEARIYYAADGAMAELDEFRIPKPSFTDHEGHVERHSRGASVISGGGQEVDSAHRRKEFVHALAQHVHTATAGRPVQLAYLFVPEHLHREVHDALPHDLLPSIAKEIHGNYCDAHPQELVRMVSASLS